MKKIGFKEALNFIKEKKEFIKKKFGIKEIGIFGSYVKGEEKEQSDIDILIEFEEGRKNFDNYIEFKFFLEEFLGRKIDLIVKSSLREELKEKILKEVVYV